MSQIKQQHQARAKLSRQFGNVPIKDTQAKKLILRTTGFLVTNAVGALNGTITFDPSGYVGWTEASSYADEFRVIGTRIQMYSTSPNSITRVSDVCCIVFDNDDTGALTSTSAAYAYADKLIFPSIFINHVNGIVFEAVRPITKSSPASWYDVGAPATSPGALKFFSEALDVTTNIIRYYIELYIEVRGRR